MPIKRSRYKGHIENLKKEAIYKCTILKSIMSETKRRDRMLMKKKWGPLEKWKKNDFQSSMADWLHPRCVEVSKRKDFKNVLVNNFMRKWQK